ncbi:MAG TPA: hypothetical protein VL096_00800 [Pirellulaceae bacterium]|nr:hypothetical protein [Pirellulaceae bacterium]
MIRQVIARKLLSYVLYSAVVTALPVLAAAPLASVVLPVVQAEPEPAPVNNACDCPCARPAAVTADPERPRWWCRGPVRRGVRGVALFVARPWRR